MRDYVAPDERVFCVGFLERLGTGMDANSLLSESDDRRILIAIRKNLENILNTRIGSVQCAPALGLCDFNDASASSMDLSLRVKINIKKIIEFYEPRLRRVSVTDFQDEKHPLNLVFTIEALVCFASVQQPIQFRLVLDSNKRYRIV